MSPHAIYLNAWFCLDAKPIDVGPPSIQKARDILGPESTFVLKLRRSFALFGLMNTSNPKLLQGTLDMLVLKALWIGPMHGYGVAQRIAQLSDKVLTVEEGSLYPAVYRLQQQ